MQCSPLGVLGNFQKEAPLHLLETEDALLSRFLIGAVEFSQVERKVAPILARISILNQIEPRPLSCRSFHSSHLQRLEGTPFLLPKSPAWDSPHIPADHPLPLPIHTPSGKSQAGSSSHLATCARMEKIPSSNVRDCTGVSFPMTCYSSILMCDETRRVGRPPTPLPIKS